jgi:hypothetical protein
MNSLSRVGDWWAIRIRTTGIFCCQSDYGKFFDREKSTGWTTEGDVIRGETSNEKPSKTIKTKNSVQHIGRKENINISYKFLPKQ